MTHCDWRCRWCRGFHQTEKFRCNVIASKLLVVSHISAALRNTQIQARLSDSPFEVGKASSFSSHRRKFNFLPKRSLCQIGFLVEGDDEGAVSTCFIYTIRYSESFFLLQSFVFHAFEGEGCASELVKALFSGMMKPVIWNFFMKMST